MVFNTYHGTEGYVLARLPHEGTTEPISVR